MGKTLTVSCAKHLRIRANSEADNLRTVEGQHESATQDDPLSTFHSSWNPELQEWGHFNPLDFLVDRLADRPRILRFRDRWGKDGDMILVAQEQPFLEN